MEDTKPLTALGDIPDEIPVMTVEKVGIEHYTLDWVAPSNRKKHSSDGTLPTQEIRTDRPTVELAISTPAQPITLTLSLFEGTVSSINPMSEPLKTFDCVAEAAGCLVSMRNNMLQLDISLAEIPTNVVVSLFAEYYRDPNFDTSAGSTNIVGWAFGLIRDQQ